MNKFTNPLSNIKIASPCSQDWNEMIGTERKRFCGECKLNVYNLSGMSEQEAENLLMIGLSLYKNYKAGIKGFCSCNFKYSVNNLFLT